VAHERRDSTKWNLARAKWFGGNVPSVGSVPAAKRMTQKISFRIARWFCARERLRNYNLVTVIDASKRFATVKK
jgi:hypothetical protein